MKVLITGGLGYIGSHTTLQLIKRGHEVIVVDDLSNTTLEVLKNLEVLSKMKIPFYAFDIKDFHNLEAIFKAHTLDAIIHFAGYKAVGESVLKPLMYYKNNILTTLHLAELADKYHLKHIIFSSSATVYGDGTPPFSEDSPLLERTNPYGETKAMSERILLDFANANKNISITLLRYFNPVGAHHSGLLGEKPNGIPNNLMPYITQVAKGLREKLYIFGNDYDTVDGTGVRDYIHVEDLARGHVLALEKVINQVNIYNLGSGKGISVLELVETFKRVNQIDIPYEITKRRAGDIASSYANASKAFKALGFKTEKTVEDMVKDSWHFEQKST